MIGGGWGGKEAVERVVRQRGQLLLIPPTELCDEAGQDAEEPVLVVVSVAHELLEPLRAEWGPPGGVGHRWSVRRLG